MHRPSLPASKPAIQKLWIPIPGAPDKHIRVEFITEIDFGPDISEETTSAIDLGRALHSIATTYPRQIKLQQPSH